MPIYADFVSLCLLCHKPCDYAKSNAGIETSAQSEQVDGDNYGVGILGELLLGENGEIPFSILSAVTVQY